MFANVWLVASDRVPRNLLSRATKGGAAVVPAALFDDKVVPDDVRVVAVVSREGTLRELPCTKLLRSRRFPIVTSLWLSECLAHNRWLPPKSPFALFDPTVFSGVIFTTSGLRAELKRNVIAFMTFFGGEYRAQLTSGCNVVVAHGGLRTSPMAPKVQAALDNGVAVAPVSWVEACYARAALLPAAGKEVLGVLVEPDGVLAFVSVHERIADGVPFDSPENISLALKEVRDDDGEVVPSATPTETIREEIFH